VRRSIATLVVAVLVGTFSVSATAGENAAVLEDVFPVAPGLVREVRAWSTLGGPQRVHVLRFRLDDPQLELRPELAMGVVVGREPVHRTLLRLGDGAVAAVNGGFWLSTPDGDPEGLFTQHGRYLSEPASQASPRGAIALFDDGTWAVGRPDHHAEVWFPSGRSVKLHGINRMAPPDGLVALTSAYAPTTEAPDDAIEAVFDLEPVPNTLSTHKVTEVRPPGGGLEPGRTVLVGRGSWAVELGALVPGDRVTFDLRSDELWGQAEHALAAGPLLIQDGNRTTRAMWEAEGFAHAVHNDRAHPRTIIGFTADGETLLVTVDGRQQGSSGVTTDEAIDLMLELGALDALMLDGGGSTTMAVDGRITNRPCCDAPGFRWVATSMVVHSSVETPDVVRIAGHDRYATAAKVAQHGWPDGAQHAFLASGTSFPDGLAGGPLAAANESPLLLTAQDRLPGPTRAALEDLGVEQVTILGGPAAISDAIAEELTVAGIAIERAAGADRFATAVEVARRLPARSSTALLASGRGFADALAAVVPAHAAQAPLLLTDRDVLPEPTRAAIEELGITHVVVAGGPAVVSDQVAQALRDLGVTVERAAGPSRYETAIALVEWAERNAGLVPSRVAVAAGAGFPDALAGGAYAAVVGAPVLLSGPDSLERTGAPGKWLAGRSIEDALVFGGRLVLSTWIGHELQDRVDAA